MGSTVDALGALLQTLRKRARMSQRALSKESGVSYTQIGDLERGAGGKPSPNTLRMLAKGVATDAFLPEGYDSIRANAFYRQMMDAAGYLRGLPVDHLNSTLTQHAAGEEAVVRFLAERAGDESLAMSLAELARCYPKMSADAQTAVRHLVGTWVNDF